MSEGEPINKELQVVAREQVRTDLGIVVRSEVLFRDTPRTVYFPTGLTNVGFTQLVADVAFAEKAAEDPIVLRNLDSDGKTVEQFVEEGSNQFVTDLRTHRYSPEIQESVLTPLVKQRAMGRLFEEAKKRPVVSS